MNDDTRYEMRTQRQNGTAPYSVLTLFGAAKLRQFLLENPEPAAGYYRTFWCDDHLVTSEELAEIMR